MSVSEKECNVCRTMKSVTDFHKSNKHKSGRRNTCKICRSQYERERYERCEYSIRERALKYYHQNKGKINEKRKGRRDPLKTWAQNALNKAITRGIIKRSKKCEKCGKKKKMIMGHHEDYSKPLEVDWWCRSCHMRYHGLG